MASFEGVPYEMTTRQVSTGDKAGKTTPLAILIIPKGVYISSIDDRMRRGDFKLTEIVEDDAPEKPETAKKPPAPDKPPKKPKE